MTKCLSLLSLVLVACGGVAPPADAIVAVDSGGIDAGEPSGDAPAETSCAPCTDPRCRGCSGGCCLSFDDVASLEASLDTSREVGPETGADAGQDAPLETMGPCVDVDGDRYGVGAGCRGPDCNDADPEVHPGAVARCDMVDRDCTGMADYLEYGGTGGSVDMDAYCRATCVGPETCTPELPPICTYPIRRAMSYLISPTAVRCQSCRRDPSTHALICSCWHDRSGTYLCALMD